MPCSTEFKLVSLTDEIRNATLGKSPFYSDRFRRYCTSYHQNGRNWPDNDLKEFFSDGLLQHYVTKTGGYDFEYLYKNFEYVNWNNPERDNYDKDRCMWLMRGLEINQEEAKQLAPVLGKLFEKIKRMDSILSLGGQFQKLKQEIEFMNTLIKPENVDMSDGDKEHLVKEILNRDRQLDALQLELYNRIRYFSFELKQFIHQHHCDPKEIRTNVSQFSPSEPSVLKEINLTHKVDAYAESMTPNEESKKGFNMR